MLRLLLLLLHHQLQHQLLLLLLLLRLWVLACLEPFPAFPIGVFDAMRQQSARSQSEC